MLLTKHCAALLSPRVFRPGGVGWKSRVVATLIGGVALAPIAGCGTDRCPPSTIEQDGYCVDDAGTMSGIIIQIVGAGGQAGSHASPVESTANEEDDDRHDEDAGTSPAPPARMDDADRAPSRPQSPSPESGPAAGAPAAPTCQSMRVSWRDQDADGFGSDAEQSTGCTAPAEFATTGGDCDDTRTDVHPGSAESCDMHDQDCDGNVDEATGLTCYADLDNDGFPAAAAVASTTCGSTCARGTTRSAPSGAMTDCDDRNPRVNPAGGEICDGRDNDCDGQADEALTRPCGMLSRNPEAACRVGSEHCSNGQWVDCTGVPAQPDTQCDGMDNNCNGLYDESSSDTSCWPELIALNGTNGVEFAMLTVTCNGRSISAPGMLRCPRGAIATVRCSVPTARVHARFGGGSCDSATRSSCSFMSAVGAASRQEVVCDVVTRD